MKAAERHILKAEKLIAWLRESQLTEAAEAIRSHMRVIRKARSLDGFSQRAWALSEMHRAISDFERRRKPKAVAGLGFDGFPSRRSMAQLKRVV